MASIEDVLAKASPQERDVRIVVDGKLASALAVAEHQHQLAASNLAKAQAANASSGSLSGGAPIVELQAALEDATAALTLAQDALKAGMDRFVMRYPGHLAWADLQALHPPRADHPEDSAWNDATFTPAAVALCCVDPVMNVDQAAALLAVLSIADRSALFGCALEVSIGQVSVPR